MAKQIFVNLPVSDVAASTAFYEALGFTKNETFSAEHASSMQWSDDIMVMLLTHDFYLRFIGDKQIADSRSTSSVLLAISLESKEAVQQFADTAKQHGGTYYQIDTGVPVDQMFGYEVQDPDGHQWEPVWMSPSFDPQAGGEV
jgi:predicted lactoylglutathione lyase